MMQLQRVQLVKVKNIFMIFVFLLLLLIALLSEGLFGNVVTLQKLTMLEVSSGAHIGFGEIELLAG